MNVDTIGIHPHRAPVHGSDRRTGTLPARLVAAFAVVAVLLSGADLAGAHGDTGELSVTRAEQSGPNRIDLEVGIVHGDDGHIASEATVSATLVGPAGDTVGPVPLAQVDPDSSLYAAEIEVSGPGSWAVAVDSTNPSAGLQTEIDVVQSPDDGAATDDTTTTTAAPATTEAPVDGTDTAAEAPLDAENTSSSNDSRWLLVGAALAAVALVAIVTFALRRNSGDDPDDDALA